MGKADEIVLILKDEIEGKDILEIGCGTADFSIRAARFAKSVCCVDIDDSRLSPEIERSGATFERMDAAKMSFSDGSFDAVFVYNALFHMRDQWDEIRRECTRVLRENGAIFIIGGWKLDRSLMDDMFGDAAKSTGGFSVVKIEQQA